MKIAIQGCCHGELDILYDTIRELELKEKLKLDALIICGDFQSIRNSFDLSSMACPQKYKRMGDFYSYYIGEKKAPLLTIFIGGNHEASHYLWELFHGGWVAPNIYFLGFAGVIRLGNLRIAGLSGIYKSHHYDLGYFEKKPFNEADSRSIYHVRHYNVFRLSLLKQPMDMFLSHDWPRCIPFHGDLPQLLKLKPFLKDEIYANQFGSQPAEFLLKRLKPHYWFAAHMHVKYAAVYHHDSLEIENPDEITISDDDNDVVQSQPPMKQVTKFLALDKILPGRQFLQVLDLPEFESSNQLLLDPEWLAIVKATDPFFSTNRQPAKLPSEQELEGCIKENIEWINEQVQHNEVFLEPPAYSHDDNFSMNPQTLKFCERFNIAKHFS